MMTALEGNDQIRNCALVIPPSASCLNRKNGGDGGGAGKGEAASASVASIGGTPEASPAIFALPEEFDAGSETQLAHPLDDLAEALPCG